MIPVEKLIELDNEVKAMKHPFDKELPVLRQKLWKLADEFHIDGADVFKEYMDWKSASK